MGLENLGLNLLLQCKLLNYYPVAFIDDNKSKVGISLCGVKIHSSDELNVLIKNNKVNTILIAIQQLSPARRAKILQFVSKFPVKVKIVPSTDDIIRGEDISRLQSISVNDVLGRNCRFKKRFVKLSDKS